MGRIVSVFSRIWTKYPILSNYRKIRIGESPYFIIFHTVLNFICCSVPTNVFVKSTSRFFLKPRNLLNFFMNWASNVAEELLNTYKHHHTETLFVFSTFVSTSRSIYVVSMWSIFHFINSITSWIQTHLFFYFFLEYYPLFLDDNFD